MDGWIYPFCISYTTYYLLHSVADDDEQPDRRDHDGRRDPESEVAPEGEVVAEELSAPGLLADNQVRGGTQEGEVPSHGADPCKDEPGLPL